MTHALLALALLAAPAAPAAPAKAAPAAPAAGPRQVVNRVAAVVNGEVVTLRDLQDRAGDEWRRAEAAPAAERAQASRKVLRRAWDALLAEKLFKAQAVQLQLEVSDGQVDAAIEDIKQRNKFDDTQLDLALASQGLDRAGFKVQIRRELESMQVLNFQVRSKVKVTEEDLRNWYQTHPAAFGGEEELHVRHLFLPLAEGAPPAAVQAAQAQGERLQRRLAAGEDFVALVREQSKGADGDLGWLRRGQIQRQLEDAFVELKDGEVSRLVRAGAGLHLFKVEGRRRAGGKTFEQARDEIRDTLTQEQSASYRDQYLAELRRDAVIELKLPELKD